MMLIAQRNNIQIANKGKETRIAVSVISLGFPKDSILRQSWSFLQNIFVQIAVYKSIDRFFLLIYLMGTSKNSNFAPDSVFFMEQLCHESLTIQQSMPRLPLLATAKNPFVWHQKRIFRGPLIIPFSGRDCL